MFPQMNDRFEAFVAPAKTQRSGWYLVLGLCLIVLFYFEFTFLIILVVSLFLGESIGFADTMMMLAKADTPILVMLTLSTFLGMAGAVTLTATVLRDRSPVSLIGHGAIFRNMLIAGAVLAAIAGIGTFFSLRFYEMVPNLPFWDWMKWMPLALPLLFVQISAEELIFRGYLQQELGARYSSPLIWILVPSLVFGALHWDTETFGDNAILIVIGTTLFGIFAADVTARTGNIGAAIGLHFTNNFFALFITSMQGDMTGMSLYLTPFDASNQDAVRTLLFWDIGSILSAYIIYLVVIRLKRDG